MKRILCYGDSNTYGYDPRSYLDGRYLENIRWTGLLKRAGWEVVNKGENGREISEGIQDVARAVVQAFPTRACGTWKRPTTESIFPKRATPRSRKG